MASLDLLLPPDVIVVEHSEVGSDAALFPEEAASLGAAAEKRRQQFQNGRVCAHEALRRLGLGPSPLPIGPRRAPRWPPGVVGSITHCEGFCAAALARSPDVLGVGIDAELLGRVTPEVAVRVCSADELAWLRGMPPTPGADWATLLWSAKESVYKCLEPAVREQPGFRELQIRPDPEGGRFEASLPASDASPGTRWPPRLAGRFAFSARHVLTAVVWRADPQRR